MRTKQTAMITRRLNNRPNRGHTSYSVLARGGFLSQRVKSLTARLRIRAHMVHSVESTQSIDMIQLLYVHPNVGPGIS